MTMNQIPIKVMQTTSNPSFSALSVVRLNKNQYMKKINERGPCACLGVNLLLVCLTHSPRVPPRLRCAAILKHFMFIYVIVKRYWTAIERALITYNIIIITPIVQCTNINTNFGFNSCDGLRRKARDASQSKVHYTVCFVCESQLYSILFPLKFT